MISMSYILSKEMRKYMCRATYRTRIQFRRESRTEYLQVTKSIGCDTKPDPNELLDCLLRFDFKYRLNTNNRIQYSSVIAFFPFILSVVRVNCISFRSFCCFSFVQLIVSFTGQSNRWIYPKNLYLYVLTDK